MARGARLETFSPLEKSVHHCFIKAVRDAWLMGIDQLTGMNYEGRKPRLMELLAHAAAWFAIDVLAAAIMANHFHTILCNRPDVVEAWSDKEVARRWLHICPGRRGEEGKPVPRTDRQINALASNSKKIAELRKRLSDISWFMQMVNAPFARECNKMEGTMWRFPNGRFRSVKLCDPEALLACMAYVDLNPIRAGIAKTPETSEFTSASCRIQSLNMLEDLAKTTPPDADAHRRDEPTGAESNEAAHSPPHEPLAARAAENDVAENGPSAAKLAAETKIDRAAAADWLAPIRLADELGPVPSTSGARCSDKGCLPITLEEYLELLDWTGRQVAPGKRGSIPADKPPILERLGFKTENWLRLTSEFGRLFHRVAGRRENVDRERNRRTKGTFHPGATELFG